MNTQFKILMNNLKNQSCNLRFECIRYSSFNVNRKIILFEERIDNSSLKKYLNLFKDKKAYNHN